MLPARFRHHSKRTPADDGGGRTWPLGAGKTALALAVVAAISFAPAGAHVTGFRHVWKKHIKPKLAEPGKINNKKNPVDWTRLKNVPPGLADGVVDGGAGGDITAVFAGNGLLGGGASGDVGLVADPDFLQLRIADGCQPGESIRTVDASGAVTCEVDDSVTAKGGYKDVLGEVPDNIATIGKLDLPAGSYMIFGKLNLTFLADAGALAVVECHLSTGGPFDVARAQGEFPVNSQLSLPMMVLHTYAGAGEARIACGDFSDNVRYRGVRIIAVPVTAFTSGGL
jgi:hypothetical protein